MKLVILLLLSFVNGYSAIDSKIDKVTNHTKNAKGNPEYALFIDMSIPSNEKRLFLVELDSKKIIYSTYVAHGKGSGESKNAVYFSDVNGSHCTALGLYKVGKNYKGKHGNSFELIGLEKSNANALERSVVIHSASYVEEKFIKTQGRCGNSWGCPAVSKEALKKLSPFFQKNIMVYIYAK
ncbi:MAG: hypothetical protein A3F72_00025 [Bacteroidetes bacterium RIFCSPLOWO2_12_FULL_35_15]|nr:MAG: hypothetical protein A3F72_00025 [Bacteroidetes bacterium RIFCSPLOWO2_12_FULL_35_15]